MVNLIMPGGGGARYQVEKSLRLRATNSAYLSRTPSASTSVQWAFNARVKRGTLGALRTLLCGWSNGSNYAALEFDSNDRLHYYEYASGYSAQKLSNAVFRDPSAWLDIVAFYDSANGTAGNRIRIWVNGVELTSWSSSTNPSSSLGSFINANGYTLYIGRRGDGTGSFDGHIAEARMITGVGAVVPTMFGKVDASTGQWVSMNYAGSYNANGFLLEFKDATSTTTIGYDTSGNANNFSTSGISVTSGVTFDQSSDTPTNNCAKLNPLAVFGSGASAVNANCRVSITTAGGNVRASFGVNSGVGYAEFYIDGIGGASGTNFAIALAPPALDGPQGILAAEYCVNGQTYNYGTASYTSYGASYTTGDWIGVKWDCDNKTVEFFKNNVSQGVLLAPSVRVNAVGVVVAPIPTSSSSSSTIAIDCNYGAFPHQYTPPIGAKALNAKNMSVPMIKPAAEGLRVLLDTGANIKTTCDAAYPGADLLALIKDRANINNWQAIDTVRGTNAVLQPNTTTAETTYSAPSGSSVGYVWKRGAPYGFDIVTYTGTGAARTVAHGLGAVPHFVIVKPRGGTIANGWRVYHRSLTSAGYYLQLNSTAAQDTYSDWNSTAPTASVFSVNGTPAQTTNENGTNYVAYCWTEIPGFSRIGAYTGNGSSDGIFVWCGFKPCFVLIKSNTSATSWMIYDAARNPANPADLRLAPNVTNAEASSGAIDFVANGFKLRANDANTNGGATGYVFAAFAEAPFKYATAR